MFSSANPSGWAANKNLHNPSKTGWGTTETNNRMRFNAGVNAGNDDDESQEYKLIKLKDGRRILIKRGKKKSKLDAKALKAQKAKEDLIKQMVDHLMKLKTLDLAKSKNLSEIQLILKNVMDLMGKLKSSDKRLDKVIAELNIVGLSKVQDLMRSIFEKLTLSNAAMPKILPVNLLADMNSALRNLTLSIERLAKLIEKDGAAEQDGEEFFATNAGNREQELTTIRQQQEIHDHEMSDQEWEAMDNEVEKLLLDSIKAGENNKDQPDVVTEFVAEVLQSLDEINSQIQETAAAKDTQEEVVIQTNLGHVCGAGCNHGHGGEEREEPVQTIREEQQRDERADFMGHVCGAGCNHGHGGNEREEQANHRQRYEEGRGQGGGYELD